MTNTTTTTKLEALELLQNIEERDPELYSTLITGFIELFNSEVENSFWDEYMIKAIDPETNALHHTDDTIIIVPRTPDNIFGNN